MAALGEDLLGVVNKLQDLVFNTIGNDSLDLPQIVSPTYNPQEFAVLSNLSGRSLSAHNRLGSLRCSRISWVEIFSLEVAELSQEDP